MKLSKLNIVVENTGLTNSMQFAPSKGKYDIEGLLKRENVMNDIKGLAESKELSDDDFEFYFKNLCDKIFTNIKAARSHNFDESFW